jgi:hypothetical protein
MFDSLTIQRSSIYLQTLVLLSSNLEWTVKLLELHHADDDSKASYEVW